MALGFLPVLLGSDANVYGMARSFYEAYGVTSAALCKRRLPATAHSRLVSVAVEEPALEEDAAFVRTLLTFAEKQTQPLLLVSCADGYTILMARHRAALAAHYRFACPPLQTVLDLDTKETFYRACAAHGLRCPRTVTCTAQDHAALRVPFDFPVVVKPSNSAAYWNCSFPHKKKVFLARDAAELNAVTAAIYASSYQDPLIVQEYIPGADSALRVLNAYCDAEHRTRLLALGQPLLEEQTPEGIGNYAAILTGPQLRDPELLGRLTAFLRDVGWVGFANFDLKYDARSGEAVLFEMNPRQGRSSYYVTAAGANLARVLVGDLLEHRPAALTEVWQPSLWRIAPYGVLRRYVRDPILRRRMARLRRQGRSACQLWCRQDRSLRRGLWYLRHQLYYFYKTARWYGRRGLHD